METDPMFIAAVDEKLGLGYGCLGLTVVGHLSRTWYEDKGTLAELLEPLQEKDPEMFVSIHGAFGFDLMVSEVVRLMGIKLRSNSEDYGATRKDRFGYQTINAYDLYCETAAIVVMTRRKKSKEVWEVDPHVMDSAIEHGMPVFALSEEGILWAWP